MWWLALAVILALIVYFWPKGLWIVLSLALVLVSGVIFWNKHEESEKATAAFTVVYAPDQCPKQKPMQVTLKNGSERTLERALFTIRASLPGFSSEVTPYTYQQNAMDKILAPGEEYTDCYPVPVLTRSVRESTSLDALQWNAEADKVFFQ